MVTPRLTIGIDIMDGLTDYAYDFGVWAENVTVDIAEDIKEEIISFLEVRYRDTPQSKKLGKPIEDTGSMGSSLFENAWKVIEKGNTEAELRFVGGGGAESSDGFPYGKIYYVDHGTDATASFGEDGDEFGETADGDQTAYRYVRDRGKNHLTRDEFDNFIGRPASKTTVYSASGKRLQGGELPQHWKGKRITPKMAENFKANEDGPRPMGDFRQAIFAWAVRSQIENPKAATHIIAKTIMAEGMQPARPSLIVNELWTENYQEIASRLRSIIASSINSHYVPSPKNATKKSIKSSISRDIPIFDPRVNRFRQPSTGRFTTTPIA